jgi:hypothetical protein
VAAAVTDGTEAAATGAWHRFFPTFYRLIALGERPLGVIVRRWGFGNIVELSVPGRRTGRPRRVYLGLLRLGSGRYVGHPDGRCGWTANLDAAGEATIAAAWLPRTTFRVERLEPGRERDAVIAATVQQHVFPGNVVYWLARRHIRAVGRYYRLERP